MVYVVSDVHGHYRELMALLKQIRFSDSDALILDGDLTDKGPEPVEVVKFAMSTPNVVTLLGNHDMMAVDSITDALNAGVNSISPLWEMNAGKYTYEKFRAEGKAFIEKYREWMTSRELSALYTLGSRTFLITHAGVDLTGHEKGPSIDPMAVLRTMGMQDIVWNRYVETLAFLPKTQSKLTMTVVCGHTPTYCIDRRAAGRIIVMPNLICMDCGAAYNEPWSRLGCIRLDDLAEYYENLK